MASDENSWVFDSLVGFLRGPVWNVPILTFVEHKSIIFEPDDSEGSGHREVHEEYKNLVDFMLGSYMEDMSITPEQFEAACKRASDTVKARFQYTIFEQVWAADDFEIFRRMMIQKNIELQLQALELIQKRYGVLPQSLQGDAGKRGRDENEDKIMEEVLKRVSAIKPRAKNRLRRTATETCSNNAGVGDRRRSLAEHEAEQNAEQSELESALAASRAEQSRLESQRSDQQRLLADHFQKSMALEDASIVVRDPVTSEVEETPEVDEAEMKRRAEFLRTQRDKLLAMKKAEREKQLLEAERAQMKSRPKSARAARSALGARSARHDANVDEQTLKVRRALAEKLRQEVIDAPDNDQ